MHSGGSVEAVAELMAKDSLRHVPGSSPTAGDYRGSDAVLQHFQTRQRLASGPMSITNGA
jgi:ketosteroid isomerase-like protein